MNVKLISDSACDMTQCEAREQGVIVLPMKTIIDGGGVSGRCNDNH